MQVKNITISIIAEFLKILSNLNFILHTSLSQKATKKNHKVVKTTSKKNYSKYFNKCRATELNHYSDALEYLNRNMKGILLTYITQ